MASVPAVISIARPKGLPRTCSDESLIAAVKAWSLGAKPEEISEYLCVPVRAVALYISSPEWHRLYTSMKSDIDGYAMGTLSHLHSLALKRVAEALYRGDVVVDKFGREHRRALSGRDAASIAATLADQQLLAAKRAAGVPDFSDAKEELGAIAAALRAGFEAQRFTKAKEIDGALLHEASEANTTGDEADDAVGA